MPDEDLQRKYDEDFASGRVHADKELSRLYKEAEKIGLVRTRRGGPFAAGVRPTPSRRPGQAAGTVAGRFSDAATGRPVSPTPLTDLLRRPDQVPTSEPVDLYDRGADDKYLGYNPNRQFAHSAAIKDLVKYGAIGAASVPAALAGGAGGALLGAARFVPAAIRGGTALVGTLLGAYGGMRAQDVVNRTIDPVGMAQEDEYLRRMRKRNPAGSIAAENLGFVLGGLPGAAARIGVGRMPVSNIEALFGGALGGATEAANQAATRREGEPFDWTRVLASAGMNALSAGPQPSLPRRWVAGASIGNEQPPLPQPMIRSLLRPSAYYTQPHGPSAAELLPPPPFSPESLPASAYLPGVVPGRPVEGSSVLTDRPSRNPFTHLVEPPTFPGYRVSRATRRGAPDVSLPGYGREGLSPPEIARAAPPGVRVRSAGDEYAALLGGIAPESATDYRQMLDRPFSDWAQLLRRERPVAKKKANPKPPASASKKPATPEPATQDEGERILTDSGDVSDIFPEKPAANADNRPRPGRSSFYTEPASKPTVRAPGPGEKTGATSFSGEEPGLRNRRPTGRRPEPQVVPEAPAVPTDEQRAASFDAYKGIFPQRDTELPIKATLGNKNEATRRRAIILRRTVVAARNNNLSDSGGLSALVDNVNDHLRTRKMPDRPISVDEVIKYGTELDARDPGWFARETDNTSEKPKARSTKGGDTSAQGKEGLQGSKASRDFVATILSDDDKAALKSAFEGRLAGNKDPAHVFGEGYTNKEGKDPGYRAALSGATEADIGGNLVNDLETLVASIHENDGARKAIEAARWITNALTESGFETRVIDEKGDGSSIRFAVARRARSSSTRPSVPPGTPEEAAAAAFGGKPEASALSLQSGTEEAVNGLLRPFFDRWTEKKQIPSDADIREEAADLFPKNKEAADLFFSKAKAVADRARAGSSSGGTKPEATREAPAPKPKAQTSPVSKESQGAKDARSSAEIMRKNGTLPSMTEEKILSLADQVAAASEYTDKERMDFVSTLKDEVDLSRAADPVASAKKWLTGEAIKSLPAEKSDRLQAIVHKGIGLSETLPETVRAEWRRRFNTEAASIVRAKLGADALPEKFFPGEQSATGGPSAEAPKPSPAPKPTPSKPVPTSEPGADAVAAAFSTTKKGASKPAAAKRETKTTAPKEAPPEEPHRQSEPSHIEPVYDALKIIHPEADTTRIDEEISAMLKYDMGGGDKETIGRVLTLFLDSESGSVEHAARMVVAGDVPFDSNAALTIAEHIYGRVKFNAYKRALVKAAEESGSEVQIATAHILEGKNADDAKALASKVVKKRESLVKKGREC